MSREALSANTPLLLLKPPLVKRPSVAEQMRITVESLAAQFDASFVRCIQFSQEHNNV